MKTELLGVSARHPAARAGAAPALKGLSLQLAAGEQVAIIGPSGAGKTTLLQVLACAMPPTAGTLTLGGTNPWQLPRSALQRLRGGLFLAPQVPPLPPRQRVVTAVLAGRLPAMGLLASLRSLFYPADIPAAFDALDRFDLADKLFERVDRLSGGERQRVGLARALLAPARLWLIDEPLSALDPTRSQQAMATLLAGARERGTTLVATLHQVDVALAHFPRIIGLRDGALAFDLPAAEVTRERLARLYDQFEHELRGDVPVAPLDTPAPGPQPVVMHCR
ncbi:MAG: ATP-binding cassette domain-containing protein [Hydrogenophaga sp.]|uniref:phosphonate ABC transporter ATP-binding protein n=1 Tax=Hydrogenophaga sp. TaxID=1904254 RepID=UPI00272625B1|nr:ATP-binding cassette domain-containing protein [Hydrogenophaga sp.]MDO9479416.1 ATP-binding cassette domain-containing protein [Hydrogenophaga sp.]MDO9570285.1 ATP-binding cassette domain-containing protein [Hydrogenophaga sp.]MDP2096543.1 ATP-binding cassette domain-containing protein [Hydrogenophaga sp.]MDP3808926.1 ATP-binding cassette domain-containing protein [Hydrogenophaga sp.]MDZ4238935.1 ATP-binding cassette domain-containing protein [Hydrogenophaga sp.]